VCQAGMVLEQVRDEMIANAKYTGDPSWKPEFSVKLLPDQQLLPYQKKGDMFAKVEVKMVKGVEPGEDQSIPGFTAAHLLMQEINSSGGVDGNGPMLPNGGGRECCLLVLNLVSSTLPCIRRPRPHARERKYVKISF
jgi:hypothetical protein